MLQLQFFQAKSQQGEHNSDNVLKQSDNNNIFKCLLWEGVVIYNFKKLQKLKDN